MRFISSLIILLLIIVNLYGEEVPNDLLTLQANKDKLIKEKESIEKAILEVEQEEEKISLQVKLINLLKELDKLDKEIKGLIKKQEIESLSLINDKYSVSFNELSNSKELEREKAINQFERMLNQNIPNSMTPSIMLKLAYLYTEKAEDDFIKAMDNYELEMDKFQKGEITIEPTEPKKDYSKAVSLYKRLINEYPSFQELDTAYYFLGYISNELQDKEGAYKCFNEIVTKFPKSQYIVESYARLGEYYFEKGLLNETISAYNEVLKFEESSFYDKALYKLGWAYFRLNQYDKAVDKFREVIDYTESKKVSSDLKTSLKKEAIEYIALSFSESGGLSKMKDYFDKIGGRDYYVDILKKLGDAYFIQTEYEKAIETYKELLAKYPNYPENPEAQKNIIEAYKRRDELPLAIKESERFVDMFGIETEWFRANSSKYDIVTNTYFSLENSLLEAATYHHEKAQKENNLKEYELAIKNYRKYLKLFPKSDKNYEMHFNLAESLYYSNKFIEAGDEYSKIRDRNDNDKYQKESAYSAILSYNKGIDEELSLEGKTFKKGVNIDLSNYENLPPISENALKFIDACHKYAQMFPDDPKREEILFKAGEINYRYGRFDEGRNEFWSIIENYPDKPIAKQSADYILDSYRVKNDNEKIKETSFKLAQIFSSYDKEFAEKLQLLGEESIFKIAENLINDGNIEEGVETYLSLAREFPNSKYSSVAIYNAAQYKIKNEKYYEGIELFNELLDKYPTSEYCAEAVFIIASIYEKVNDIENALKYYEKSINEYPNSEYYQKALYNAGVYHEALENYENAIRLYTTYIFKFPNSEDVPELVFSKASLLKKIGKEIDAQKEYDYYLTKFPNGLHRVESALLSGRILRKLGLKKLSDDKLKKVLEYYKVSNNREEDAKFAAEAKFLLNQSLFDEFNSISFNVPEKMLQKQFNKKTELLAKIVKEYGSIVEFGALEWIMASYLKIGESYEKMGESYREAPIPKGLSPEEEEEYKMAVEEQATPLEEKAIAKYEDILKIAKEKGIENEWSKLAYEKLLNYRPNLSAIKIEKTNIKISDTISDRGNL